MNTEGREKKEPGRILCPPLTLVRSGGKCRTVFFTVPSSPRWRTESANAKPRQRRLREKLSGAIGIAHFPAFVRAVFLTLGLGLMGSPQTMQKTGAFPIRPGTPEDAPAIIEILHSVDWLKALCEVPPELLEKCVRAHIARCSARDVHLLLVAEAEDGKAAGFLLVHFLPHFMFPGPEAYVPHLFVRADLRGRGVGSALLGAAHEAARERGCSRLMLITGRDQDCYKKGFYPKQGLAERPHIANFVRSLMDGLDGY
jgi:GNAT superfamily N-acetyltransferase